MMLVAELRSRYMETAASIQAKLRAAALFSRVTFATRFPPAETIFSMLRAKFFFAASLVLGFASGQTALTSQSVLDDIHAKGAQAVINGLYNDGHEGQQWERLLNKIETGADGWLDVAEKLYSATDAATRVGMNVSIAVALTRNPAAVLQRTGRADWPTLDKVCTVPFIESDPKTDMAHIQKVRAALRRVAVSSLDDKKAECLKLINADAEHLKR